MRRGNGSTLRGHALIDAIESLSHGHSSAAVTALTLGWYAIPACGALAWIVVGFGDPRGGTGRAVATVTLLVTAAIDAYFWVKLGTRAGPGVYLSALGALSTCVVWDRYLVPKRRMDNLDRRYVRGISRSS